MGVQIYKKAKAPEQWIFELTAEQLFDNRDRLLFAGGDDPRDEEHTRDENDVVLFVEGPVLDPYSAPLDATLAFKCDETLRDWVDLVGSEHRFSRSEVLRRLVYLGITQLEGRIKRVSVAVEAEAA